MDNEFPNTGRKPTDTFWWVSTSLTLICLSIILTFYISTSHAATQYENSSINSLPTSSATPNHVQNNMTPQTSTVTVTQTKTIQPPAPETITATQTVTATATQTVIPDYDPDPNSCDGRKIGWRADNGKGNYDPDFNWYTVTYTVHNTSDKNWDTRWFSFTVKMEDGTSQRTYGSVYNLAAGQSTQMELLPISGKPTNDSDIESDFVICE